MKRTTAIMLLAAAAAASAGCQPAKPPLLQGEVMVGGRDSAAYLDAISSRPTVTEAEALEGILLVLGGQGEKRTFADAVEHLVGQGVVDPKWGHSAEREVTKGRVAYMVYQVCKIRGGLTLTLFGPSRRYCLKELQYRGLMSEGLTYTTVTGMEYVAILTRADEHRETGEVSDVLRRQEGVE